MRRLRDRLQRNLSGLVGPLAAVDIIDAGVRIDPAGATVGDQIRALESELVVSTEVRDDLAAGRLVPVLEGWQINSEAQMEKLRKEVSLMVQFSSSPHIVQVWESGYEEGLGPWVAMEFLGTSLKDELIFRSQL